MIDQKKLEAIKSKKIPYLLVVDRGEYGLYSKVHFSLGNAKIGAHQEREYVEGRVTNLLREVIIFEWNGNEWTELYHIEAGTHPHNVPWKSSKG